MIGSDLLFILTRIGFRLCIYTQEKAFHSDKFIMFSAPIVHGNSGGPVFNGNGEVIGIATLGREDALAMNYAIPVSAVKDFIEKAKDKEEVEVTLKTVK